MTSGGDPAVELGLVEPARQRLLGIAADVLGRMPVDEIPAPLRPIARFAPAKRARLGASVLSAALDGDAGFRARVAEPVRDGSPQLVEAVEHGGSTAAGDPLDVGVVAYLVRPEGWQSVLAAANARWLGERADGVTADEAARLRAEVGQLRERLKAEGVRVRAAVNDAGSASAAEIGELKRQLRARTGELRIAERDRDAAQAAAAEAAAQLAAAVAGHEIELRRVRGRVSELERAAESVRRETRSDRELDDARLWLLTETLTAAAAGIRRELSLSPPSARPGDAVTAVAATVRDRQADDPAGLDRLLGLPQVHVIVDGYNVTKTGYAELALVDQRTRLIRSMAALGSRSGAEITVVFDGDARPPVQPPAPRGVRVLFSAADEIADDLIRRLVAAEPSGRPIVVVTSDHQVVVDVQRAGAWAVPSAVLLARLG